MSGVSPKVDVLAGRVVIWSRAVTRHRPGVPRGSVNKTIQRKPTRLDAARERLVRAVTRLEQAVAAREERGTGSSEDLEELKIRHAALKRTTDTVSSRLDAVISQLRSVLEV